MPAHYSVDMDKLILSLYREAKNSEEPMQYCRRRTKLEVKFILPQAEFIRLQGNLFCFYGFSTNWMWPAQIIEDNLLYLKSTDCRC